MAYTFSGLWNNTKFYCGNHDDAEAHPMEFQTGSTVFYACPDYKVQDAGDRSCPNRLSVEDAEGIVTKISKDIADIEADGLVANINGLRFDYKKKIYVKVRSYDPNTTELKIDVINHKAIRAAGGSIATDWNIK